MNKIINTFDAFLFSKISAAPLAYFRIGIAGLCLMHIAAFWPDIPALWGNQSYIFTDINKIFITDSTPQFFILSTIQQWLSPANESSTLCFLFYMYIGSLLFLLTGLCTRVAALLSWYLHFVFVKSTFLSSYGMDYILTSALFYCLIMPVNRYFSLDSLLFKPQKMVYSFSLRLIQIHLCLIYFFAGIAKILGAQWWSGEAIWRSLNRYAFYTFDFGWLSNYPLLCQMLSLTVVFIESTYFIGIWFDKTRKFWLFAAICTHLNIMLFMKLYYFGWLLIVFNLAAFYFPYAKFRSKYTPSV